MKIFAPWFLFVVLIYVVQSSLLPTIGFNGVSADLMLLLTVSFSFLRGAKLGAMMGFLAGLLSDLATGTFFGIGIFSKMLIGFFCGMFSKRVFKEQMLLPLISVLISTAAQDLMTLIFIFLLGYRPNIFYHLHQLLLPTLFFNTVFALPVHYLVSKMCEWLKAKK